MLNTLTWLGAVAAFAGFVMAMEGRGGRNALAGMLLFIGGMICFVGGVVGQKIVEAIRAGGPPLWPDPGPAPGRDTPAEADRPPSTAVHRPSR
jgi:drug/metabolite transporter (DMT)-like permease